MGDLETLCEGLLLLLCLWLTTLSGIVVGSLGKASCLPRVGLRSTEHVRVTYLCVITDV